MGVDPGITNAPEQQQRRRQFREKLIEGLAAGDIEDGAEHPEGAGIQGGTPNRLHQPVIDVGLIHIHLVQGAADRGGSAQVLEQQPLQHRTLQQGRADALAGDGTPALRRFLLITCLLYTSPSPRDQRGSRMPSSA